jgi:Zn finger protein HypA/HybF involved in hydrogenase expression
MIITKQAQDLNDTVVEVAHKVEILCPNCDRDVDEAELTAQVCSDCGHDLSEPKQSVEIHATSIPLFAITFTQ